MQSEEVLEAASLKDDCRYTCHTHLYSPEARGKRGIPLRMAVPLEERLWGEPQGRGNSLGHGDCPSFKPLNTHTHTHRSHKASGRAKKLKNAIAEMRASSKTTNSPRRFQSAGAGPSSRHSAGHPDSPQFFLSAFTKLAKSDIKIN